MGLYKPNGIPWEGKSAVVPMKAVENMRKLNHNWNWLPLEDIERTCRIEQRETVSGNPPTLPRCSACLAVVKDDSFCYCPRCGARIEAYE